jgi:hypothetical protein
MYKRAARHLDYTSTGGRIYANTACATFDEEKLVAFGGSVATCGTCEGTYPVIASYDGWTDNGEKMVLDLDHIACPCRKNYVLAGADSAYLIETAPSKPFSDGARIYARPEEVKAQFDECYILRHARTGKPIANVAYRLVSATGETMQGVTDSAGRTQRIKAGSAQKIRVEIKEAE